MDTEDIYVDENRKKIKRIVKKIINGNTIELEKALPSGISIIKIRGISIYHSHIKFTEKMKKQMDFYCARYLSDIIRGEKITICYFENHVKDNIQIADIYYLTKDIGYLLTQRGYAVSCREDIELEDKRFELLAEDVNNRKKLKE